MKKLLALFLLLPAFAYAQPNDPTATMDVYGCYVYTLRTFINGKAGVDKMKAATESKKNKTLYVSKQMHTAGLPDSIDGYAVKFVDVNADAANLSKEIKKKTASVLYLSPLSLGADTCTLWLMPISFKKEGDAVVPEYEEKGCMFYYYYNKTTQKMGFAKTVYP